MSVTIPEVVKCLPPYCANLGSQSSVISYQFLTENRKLITEDPSNKLKAPQHAEP
jgi:hypothetical protein